MTVIESDAAGGSVEELIELMPTDKVVALVCHGTVRAETELALPATRVVLALGGCLEDRALTVAAQSAVILATDRATFVDRGREEGESFASVLQARLPIGEITRMSLTAQPVTAADAHRVGLVDRLISAGALREEAINAALLIADIDQP